MRELLAQSGTDWRCSWFDDASDDGTQEQANLYAKKSSDRVHVFQRVGRCGPLQNVVFGLDLLAGNRNDVIVLWDADDFFAHDRVLRRIAEEFRDPDVWMTYGHFRALSGREYYSGAYGADVVAANGFRAGRWLGAPPRAFRRWLFDAIPPEYLRRPDGRLWDTATDQALTLALLERAGTHARHIEEVLYLYNDLNPASDHHVRLQEQTAACVTIRRMPPLQPLAERPR